jgi:hypothetical protein
VTEEGDESELVAVVEATAVVELTKLEERARSCDGTCARCWPDTSTPPDKQEAAVLLVLQQAETLASDSAA